MIPETMDKIQRHLEHSDIYFANVQVALDKEEVTKAGEMLWGSVTQVFHALAAVRGANVETHRNLKNFAIIVSNQLDDPYILAGFMTAEILHKGFYDIDVELTDIQNAAPIARRVIDVVAGLIPEEVNGGSSNQS